MLLRASLPLHQRAVLADEEVEVGALLVGKFEEDLLAFRILETLAVFLEELVGPALAADADHQGLLIVHAVDEALGTFGKEPVRSPFEEEKRRPGLEVRVALQQSTKNHTAWNKELGFGVIDVRAFLASF